MSRLSRGKGDVIDLPELHRRGFVKFPEPEEQIDEIDFTSSPAVAEENKSSDTESKSSSGVSDFLSDFASIGSSNNSSVSENPKLEISASSDKPDFNDSDS